MVVVVHVDDFYISKIRIEYKVKILIQYFIIKKKIDLRIGLIMLMTR